MSSERRSVWTGIVIGMLLVWGVLAPVVAWKVSYWNGYRVGIGHSVENAKKHAKETVAGLKKSAAGATALVKDSFGSATVSLTSGTSVLATGLGNRTERLMSGLGGSLTSATQRVSSYTTVLGSDLKEGARDAEAKLKSEARWAREAVGRRTDRVMSGVKRRVSGFFDDEESTAATEAARTPQTVAEAGVTSGSASQ